MFRAMFLFIRSEKNKNNTGFTLVELLVVIAIIGLLSTISIVALRRARENGLVARRLADMHQIQNALAMYLQIYGEYPTSDYDGSGGWDVGNTEYQLLTGKLPGIMDNPPNDPTAAGNYAGYIYYRYPAGSYGCDINKGAFYVLGIVHTGLSYPYSPGWHCPDRNWGGDWLIGSFEKD